jgi:hypothetical protein
MMQGLREFLDSRTGKSIAGGVILLCLVFVALSLKSTFGASESAQATRHRTLVDSETGQPFEVDVDSDFKIPAKSPFSGKMTGYQSDETCWWTADGKVSETPTYIVMNATRGVKGPTFCPVCKRLVVENNPQAAAGMKVPPTESQYRAGVR